MKLPRSTKIYVAGHTGMAGSAICRKLEREGFDNVLTVSSKELDLTDRSATFAFLAENKPDIVIVAAARVGGIYANSTYPAEFIYTNLSIALNCVHGSYEAGVKRLLFLGSSCIYPKEAPQPMPESCLLSGPLEPTNEAYAIAKIAGIKMCQFYREQYGLSYHSAMPTNLFGPGDNYHVENSHVVAALIRRFHEAKEAGESSVEIWGTGKPLREFLHADDLASAILYLIEMDSPPDIVNVGSDDEASILDLARTVKEVVGFEGDITHDLSKPDGTMRKLMDSSLLREAGWRPYYDLKSGMKHAYEDFLSSTEHRER